MHNDLWTHAVALYGRPEVQQSCLTLQSRGANVCLLLCAAWLGETGVAFSTQRLAALAEVADAWHGEVVAPLRQLRQQWRAQALADDALRRLREQVKGLELQAERVLLERLQALCNEWPREGAMDVRVWLEQAVPREARDNRGALHVLRAAVTST